MCNAQQAANLTASFRSQPILNPIIRATRVNYRFRAWHALTDRYGEQIPSDGSWPTGLSDHRQLPGTGIQRLQSGLELEDATECSVP